MSIWSKLTNLDNKDDILLEMVKKYKNTILKIVNGKDIIYAKYNGYDKNGFHFFRDLLDNDITVASDTNLDVRIWYPQKGLYNITTKNLTHFIYFSRTANRQYRLGINEDNSRITCPTLDALSMGPLHYHNLATLKQISEKQYPLRHLDEVIDLLENENNTYISYAINQRWGISAPLTDNPNKYPVWLYDKHVADIENFTITFKDKTFIQELTDEPNNDWRIGYGIK